jgi:restriction system protein
MASRWRDASVKLLVLGAGLALAPLLLASTRPAKLLMPLSALGIVLLGAAALLYVLSVRQRRREALRRASEPESDSLATTQRTAAAVAATRPPAAMAGEAPVRPTAWSAEVFDQIEWRRFEAVVETLFQQAGFETRTQTHGADGGVDIWLHSRHQPGAPVSLVQCKHWSGKRVGVDKVRELRGVMAAHNVRRGQFATTSSFSADAVAFARDNGIHLLDATALLSLIAQRSVSQQFALLEVALEGEYWRPTCVNCGDKMVSRPGRDGAKPFWGCSNYPRCRHTLAQRAG